MAQIDRSEALVEVSSEVSDMESDSLHDDSDIEILDSTVFPMPFLNDGDVAFVSSEHHSVPSRINSANSDGSRSSEVISVRSSNSLHDDSDIEIIGFSTFPIPRLSDEDDVVFVTSERPSTITGLTPRSRSPESTEPEIPGNGFTCAVCLEDLKADLRPVSTYCGHLFCLNCLLKSIRISGKCPLCKKEQGKDTFHRIFI